MAIQMTFYSNFSKRINSTKQPTNGTTYDIVFKDAFSILGGNVNLQVSFDVAKNFTMAKYENTYFNITDIVSVSDGLVEISMEIDVLSTYKSEISAYESLIERSPNSSFSVDLTDGTIAPTGRYKYSEHDIGVSVDGTCFQLKTKNGVGVLAYFFDLTAFNELLIKFEINIFNNEYKYIESLKVVPLDVHSVGGSTISEIYVGQYKYNIESGSCYAIYSPTTRVVSDKTIPTTSIANMYSDARRYDSNYVDIGLLLDGKMFSVSPNYLRSSSFSLDVFIDSLTLDVLSQFTTNYEGGHFIVASSTTNVGIGVQFMDTPNEFDKIVTALSDSPMSHVTGNSLSAVAGSAISSAENTMLRQGFRTRNRNRVALGELSDGRIGPVRKGFIGMVSAGASAGRVLLSSAIPAAIPSVLLYAYKQTMAAHTVGSPSGSALVAWTLPNAKLCVKEFESTDRDIIEFGFPYMRYENINKIGSIGYYKFVAPNIEIDSVQSIKSSINEFLQNGFFYE